MEYYAEPVVNSHHTHTLTHSLDLLAGCDVNTRDYDGRTALHVASQLGFINVVTCLVRLGVDRDLKDRWNKSSMDIARERGHEDILYFLAPDWKGPRDV